MSAMGIHFPIPFKNYDSCMYKFQNYSKLCITICFISNLLVDPAENIFMYTLNTIRSTHFPHFNVI